jgi:hypothetical protein
MEHSSLPAQTTIHSTGVRMTASEANHQRVLALILAEEIQMFHQVCFDLDKKLPGGRRGKPPMSEAKPISIPGMGDSSQMPLFRSQ